MEPSNLSALPPATNMSFGHSHQLSTAVVVIAVSELHQTTDATNECQLNDEDIKNMEI